MRPNRRQATADAGPTPPPPTQAREGSVPAGAREAPAPLPRGEGMVWESACGFPHRQVTNLGN